MHHVTVEQLRSVAGRGLDKKVNLFPTIASETLVDLRPA